MSENLIGMTINGYDILSQVGQGGMATVFLARQQSMDRNVALKFLPKQFMNDDTYLQRFEQEVKIVSQLEHRNIVPVYDYGEWEGQPYIAMRYMPAGSIDDLLQQGRIPLDRILNIAEQIAPALDYAHSKNILHRDLKPSNILLDDGGGAFITDFGIARILSEQGPAITTQGVVGTPSYMSPEQAQAHDLDGRSDVYSLGVMMFEMLTGRRPFESDTPYSIAVMQVTTPPPSPRDYDDSVTSAIEKVVLKSLHKKPEKRYDDATDLTRAFRLAVERPHSTHDTEPRMRPAQQSVEPVIPAEPQQIVPPIVQTLYPQGGTSHGMQQPVNPASRPVSYPVRSVKGKFKPKRNNIWLSIAVGGVMGCALLAAVVVMFTLAVGSLSNDPLPIENNLTASDTPADTEDNTTQNENPSETGTPDPTLDFEETSTVAQITLRARESENSDELTSAAQTRAFITPSQIPAFIPVGVRGTPTLNAGLRDVSGKLIYFDQRFDSDDKGSFEVVSLNLENWTDTQLTSDLSDNTYPLASPDGRWITFQSDRDGNFDIFVVNIVGGQLRQLTRNSVWDRLPAWSPDSDWIIYSSDVRDDGTFDLYRIRPDGSQNEVVYSDGRRNSHARYSPDGRYIVFTSGEKLRDANTWEIALLDTQTQAVKFLTQNEYRDSSPSFSPDGERILYITTIGDDTAIATMNLDGEDIKIIHDGAGNEWAASYSPDGNFIVVTTTIEGEDQLLLMEVDGSNVQQITSSGGAYASWIPAIGN